MEELRLLVRELRWEAEDVLSLGLVDPRGGRLPGWAPGAHIDLRITPGLERQYSLYSDPADRGQWRVAVLREDDGRGGSRYVHQQLRPGDLVTARGPLNKFELRPAARYVFLAGGIGITPILPMIRAVKAQNVPWRLAYLGRRAARMAFAADPLLDSPAVRLAPADRGERLDIGAWTGAIGSGTAVYCCGPPRLLDAVSELSAGWPPGSLRLERFQPVPQPARPAGGSLTVCCRRSGRTVVVGPDQTILACLEAAGIAVDSSCREGVCGTCETRLIEGMPDHRDSILTPDERAAGETMMICVSRARTPELVLDV
jgi:ferredoxin-NADP reductase